MGDAGSNQKKKLTVKLANGSYTKRVRDVPENFAALKSAVKAQMAKGEQSDQQLILANQFSITYKDDTGDIINVSDDEDLFAAYDVAEGSLGGQLKFEVKPRAGGHQINDSAMDEIINSKSKVQEEMKLEEKPEDEEMQLRASYVKAAIKEAIDSKHDNLKDEDDTENDQAEGSDSEEDPALANCKGRKRNRGNREKQKIDKNGGLPRKAFKRLIKKELDKQC